MPMLTHLEPHVRCLCKNMLNVTGPKNTVNYRGFCRHAHPTRGRRQGVQPLSPTERRETPYGYATARGPLAGFKRLRATAGQGPNYVGQLLLLVVVVVVAVVVAVVVVVVVVVVVGCWWLVGCWLLVVGCWAHFVPSWSHVSPSWAHIAPILRLCSLILGLC